MKRLIVTFAAVVALAALQAKAEGSSEENWQPEEVVYDASAAVAHPQRDIDHELEADPENSGYAPRKPVSLISDYYNGNLDPLNVLSQYFPLPNSYNSKYNFPGDNLQNSWLDQYNNNPIFDPYYGDYHSSWPYINQPPPHHGCNGENKHSDAATQPPVPDEQEEPAAQEPSTVYNINIVYSLNLCRDGIART